MGIYISDVLVRGAPYRRKEGDPDESRCLVSQLSFLIAMELHVSRLGHNLKVGRVIVQTIAVFVVNNFTIIQHATQHCCGDQSMLRNVSLRVTRWMLRKPNMAISTMAYLNRHALYSPKRSPLSCLPVALHGAILHAADSIRLCSERFSALLAKHVVEGSPSVLPLNRTGFGTIQFPPCFYLGRSSAERDSTSFAHGVWSILGEHLGGLLTGFWGATTWAVSAAPGHFASPQVYQNPRQINSFGYQQSWMPKTKGHGDENISTPQPHQGCSLSPKWGE